MFNFYDTNYANTIFADYYTSAKTLNLIAYTATFGGGFYATLSIEDSIARRGTAPDDDNVRFDGITAAGYGDVNGNGVTPAVDDGKWRAEREGSDIPDIVAAIGVSQSWGKAQIMAAVHNIDARADFLDVGVGGADVRVDGEEWGYAVGAGVGVNLPIAAGGHFAIEAVYADGALKYLGDTIGDEFTNHRISYDDNNTNGVADDVSSVDTGSGYSITGEFQVNLSASLVATAFGSYASVDNASKDIIDASGSRLMDTNSYIIGANLVYTITKGLTVGTEVSYVNTEFNYVDRTFINAPGNANPRVFSSEESEDLNFGIRLERKW